VGGGGGQVVQQQEGFKEWHKRQRVNILIKICAFLGSTNFKQLNKIKGNSINKCDIFKAHNLG
jgi:hypothetical protein